MIASMPSANPGLISAGATIYAMKQTFHAIRYYFLVGIAGGIPRNPPNRSSDPSSDPDADIHLGDVVISCPRASGTMSVVQYGAQRITQGATGSIKENIGLRWDTLDFLKSAAATFVARLQATNNEVHREYQELLSRSTAYNHNIYKRPDPDTDRLFHKDFIHICDRCEQAPQDLSFCSRAHRGVDSCTSCSLAENQQVQRPKRQHHEPVFHAGQICSGDSLIQSAVKRDRIAAEFPQGKCLDMEAASVIYASRCLVVRGISDYADSHRNHGWSDYAAGIAMVFTRCFIRYLAIEQTDDSSAPPIGELSSENSEKPETQRTLPSVMPNSASGASQPSAKEEPPLIQAAKKHLSTFLQIIEQTKIQFGFWTATRQGNALELIDDCYRDEMSALDNAKTALSQMSDSPSAARNQMNLAILRGYIDIKIERAKRLAQALPKESDWNVCFECLDGAIESVETARKRARGFPELELEFALLLLLSDSAIISLTRAQISHFLGNALEPSQMCQMDEARKVAKRLFDVMETKIKLMRPRSEREDEERAYLSSTASVGKLSLLALDLPAVETYSWAERLRLEYDMHIY